MLILFEVIKKILGTVLESQNNSFLILILRTIGLSITFWDVQNLQFFFNHFEFLLWSFTADQALAWTYTSANPIGVGFQPLHVHHIGFIIVLTFIICVDFTFVLHITD